MSFRDLFHDYLDEAWPLWKQPKNNGGVKYNQLYRAFEAGYKLSEEGATAEQIGATGGSMSVLEAITMPPRKFVPPKRRRRKNRVSAP